MPRQVDILDAVLNHRILTAQNPSHWWAVKVRAKRILAHSPQPEVLAGRILTLL